MMCNLDKIIGYFSVNKERASAAKRTVILKYSHIFRYAKHKKVLNLCMNIYNYHNEKAINV